MPKIDRIVKKETGFIALVTLLFSAVMQVVFFLLDRWNATVLFGNLLGGSLAVLNFFLMGIGVQRAVGKEEKEARDIMKLSQTLRMMLLFVTVVIGVVLDVFHTVAVIIPLLFPRIAVSLRPIFMKKEAENIEE